MQSHAHLNGAGLYNSGSSAYGYVRATYETYVGSGAVLNARTDVVTRGKSKGVKFIIKVL